MAAPTQPRKKPGRPKGSVSAGKSRPKTAKARLREYERTLPKLSLNDYTMLENMVDMEMRFPVLREQMQTETDALKLRKTSEALAELSKEYRLIQDHLGIGRSSRSTDIDMQQEVDSLVRESTELVERVGRKIACQYCQSDYEMGVVLFHFRDDVGWRFEFNCPACGKFNRMSGPKLLVNEANGS